MSVFKDSQGVVGRTIKQSGVGSRILMESWSIEGDTPVCETDKTCECVPEYHGTLEIQWESGQTTV